MIRLEIPPHTGVTVLSNVFIDQYMPAANGEFVKVYIYLLRNLSSGSTSFSLELMADSLQNTEKDICRALAYWESTKLLSLSYDEDQKLSGIQLHTVPAPPELPDTAAAVSRLPVLEQQSPPAQLSAPSASEPELTPERIRQLKQNEDVVQLLYIAEQYLGKTLSPTEMKKLLFLYDGLHMSPDLIEYLIEYCVLHNHKSVRYMETVAFAWAEDGIRTVAQAKERSSRYKKEYYTILNAMGISGRQPVPDEVSFMESWLNQNAFPMEIIREACSRTVLKTGQASFPYADGILKDWKRKNVRNLQDVQALDVLHQKKKSSGTQAARSNHSKPNQFNNFQQRKYDFSDYEKRLLNQ